MTKNIYKTFLLSFAIAFTFTTTQAQQRIHKCGTIENLERLKQQDNTLEQRILNDQKILSDWIATHAGMRTSTGIDTIPVVVHVVYRTTTENISDAQVNSQITILNQDFGRTNPDAVNTPAVWQSIAGSLPYRFHLARKDPNGFPTTGIERRQTTDPSFTTDDQVKFNSQGGMDAWDVNRYLNIWVCNLGSQLLGYGEFPSGTHTNTYGFVCHHIAFGTLGTVQAPYDGGRTTTHEISHCFNLEHIWGDDFGSCSGSDNISDTPNQGDATYGCYTFPHTDACATSSPGIMFMNYMDYSDDNCLNMFTQGQANVIVAAITNFYPTLLTSDGLDFVITLANDAGIATNVYPAGTICATTISPIVTVRNFGSAALTSAIINYKVDAGALNTFAWTGNIASASSLNVTLPNLTVTAGSHTFTSYTTNPNSSTDGNNVNDTTVSSFLVASIGGLVPLTEGFESTTFPPLNWEFNNPDGGTTWDRITGYKHSGNASAHFDNFNYNASGQIDDIVTPHLNLSAGSAATLTFWVAYAYYTVPLQYSDTLQVLISTDCGVTFTSIYKKWADNLSTAPPTTAVFHPTAAQWRQETVDLTPFAGHDNVYIVFRNITDYENDLYIDDVNIDIATGVKELGEVSPEFGIYPNPSHGELTIYNEQSAIVQVEIYNTLGEVVYTVTLSGIEANEKRKTINENFPSGIYFVRFTTSSGTSVIKFTVAK